MVNQDSGKLTMAPSMVSTVASRRAALSIFIILSFKIRLYTYLLKLTLTWKNEYRICETQLQPLC